MKSILNGAPGLVNRGVQDLSGANFSRAPLELPQHLPKYMIFAQTGPLTEELLVGIERSNLYGEETFTEGSDYFTHQTLHSNGVNAQGNAAIYKRLLPTDAGPKPSACVYLDVLPTQVDLYERNVDGSVKTDAAGDPTVLGQTPGYRVKFVVKHHLTHEDALGFGGLDIVAGDQHDPITNVQSQRYPIFEAEHSFFGKDGNLAGFRIWAQTLENVSSMPTKLMAREKVYPYSFSIVRKNKVTGTPKTQETIFGEQSVTIVLKPKVIDPLTQVKLYLGQRAVNDYQNLTDAKYAKVYGQLGRFAVYQNNIDRLVALFHAAEVPFLTDASDMTASTDDAHLFNFITGVDSNASPYHSFIFSDDTNAVRLSASTTIYLDGGSDGTLSFENHANLTGEYMDRYADEKDELNDIAYHVESHIYDTGFPIEVKYKLTNFISNRKDTFVLLTPHVFGERTLTQAEEYSIAASLQSHLALNPESTYFGTSVYRALIQGSSGLVRGSSIEERMPLTYELGVKSAAYMGAANGAWKNGKNFDGHPGSLIENQYDLSNSWVPDDVRNRNWDVGLNWIMRYDRESFIFPCSKTVYSDDTSVLTSYITACAIIYLNKILDTCHRTFTGTSGLTAAQFSDRVNDHIREKVKGRFDGRFIVEPRCFFTSLDQVRNYSWTVPVDIYAPGMKTVMTAYVVSRRIEDYKAA